MTNAYQVHDIVIRRLGVLPAAPKGVPMFHNTASCDDLEVSEAGHDHLWSIDSVLRHIANNTRGIKLPYMIHGKDAFNTAGTAHLREAAYAGAGSGQGRALRAATEGIAAVPMPLKTTVSFLSAFMKTLLSSKRRSTA